MKDTMDATKADSQADGNEDTPSDFIRDIGREDLKSGKHKKIVTRFPPEPNGYLHIGHAKAFCLNFGLAEEFGGQCNLRFDDTNPDREDTEYVESIQEDLKWMGFDWGDGLFFASDYFDQLYDFAVELIQQGKAFVCDLSPEEMRAYRGTVTEEGKNSPYRDRPAEENLDLFERMKNGEPHIVPLSRQVMELLRQLQEITGVYRHMFPKLIQRKGGGFDDSKTLNENAAREVIQKMGYDCVPHGFRSMASSYLNSIEEGEEGWERAKWDSLWIEYCLSHLDTNEMRRTYNEYDYMKARTRMLQWYADEIIPKPSLKLIRSSQ